MRHLTPLDRALALIMVAVWVGAFGLYLKEAAPGRLSWVPVFVSGPSTGEPYPIVREFRGGSGLVESALAVGDRLRRVGDADLRGVGPVGFIARAHGEAGGDLRVRVVYERNGNLGETSIRLVRVRHAWGIAPMVAALAVTAVLVLLRLPRAPVGRAFFLAAMSFSTHWCLFGGGPPAQTWAWAVVFFVSSLVMFPLSLRLALLFPEEVAPPGGRLPPWPWAFAAFGPLAFSWMFGTPFSHAVGQRGVYLTNVAFLGTSLWLLTRHHRRSGPIGRRQLKWVLYGVYVSFVPVIVVDLVTASRPALWWLHEVTPIALIPLPVCFLIGIVRYNLFDIDRLITLTAAYSALSIALVAVGLMGIPQLARLAAIALDLSPDATLVVLSLALAASLAPAGRRLRPRIEAWFFPERRRLEFGLHELLRELAACVEPLAMLALVGRRLGELLRPEVVRIYGITREGCRLLFAEQAPRRDGGPRGGESGAAGALAPAPSEIVLAAAQGAAGMPLPALATLTAPADLGAVRDSSARRLTLPEPARQALSAFGIEVVVPVRRGGRAAAAICLGPKRSGDVYTSTDLTLLGALADKVSSEMLRFDEAEILRQERAMQEALREYVPDPVVELLASGRRPEGGEREVSILFVDLTSFSAYSERHSSETVFSVVNRYTEAASRVIRAHGGTVVEFLGDGMMAVFGAPVPAADHARAALECGREIVVAVQALGIGDPGSEPIGVSVGITTGRAFVGNVRSADRLIYTAIGDVANLAARLEGLTRRLDATIAVDAATRDGAGEAAAAFVRHGPTLVRGREQAVDVYFLPRTVSVTTQGSAVA